MTPEEKREAFKQAFILLPDQLDVCELAAWIASIIVAYNCQNEVEIIFNTIKTALEGYENDQQPNTII